MKTILRASGAVAVMILLTTDVFAQTTVCPEYLAYEENGIYYYYALPLTASGPPPVCDENSPQMASSDRERICGCGLDCFLIKDAIEINRQTQLKGDKYIHLSEKGEGLKKYAPPSKSNVPEKQSSLVSLEEVKVVYVTKGTGEKTHRRFFRVFKLTAKSYDKKKTVTRYLGQELDPNDLGSADQTDGNHETTDGKYVHSLRGKADPATTEFVTIHAISRHKMPK